MSVKDVIKNGVYESFGGSTDINGYKIAIILLAACLIGVYIFVIYKYFSRSAFYSRDLNVTIAGMAIVVAAIMIAMQSNILVSLGMVGALSIVRFRTAIKNPLDLLYLFWSISAGIICGVSLYSLAIILSIIMTIIIWLLNKVPAAKAPALVVIKSELAFDSKQVEALLKENCDFYHLSSIMTRSDMVESVYEVRLKDKESLVLALNKLDGIKAINCLEHDGEVRA